VRVKRRRSGAVKWGAIRSGTIVVRPTLGARAFVERWVAEGKDARFGDVDQDTLMLALGRTPWVSFTVLPVDYCATVGDKCLAPVIFHDSASAGDRTKLTKWDRWLGRLMGGW
jgi:hypothetical protein